MKLHLLVILTTIFSVTASANNELIESLHLQLAAKHTPIKSFRQARTYVHGHLYLEQYDSNNNEGLYFITSFYCGAHIGGSSIGSGKLPDTKWINTEHLWPQSRFKNENISIKKTDLFNMVPVLPEANSTRSNKRFGDVSGRRPLTKQCNIARISDTHVEPADWKKGDIARAMFYFATRYSDLTLEDEEEETLRKWHTLDPVDLQERELNQRIYEIQNIRNPYIDYPGLVKLISDF